MELTFLLQFDTVSSSKIQAVFSLYYFPYIEVVRWASFVPNYKFHKEKYLNFLHHFSNLNFIFLIPGQFEPTVSAIVFDLEATAWKLILCNMNLSTNQYLIKDYLFEALPKWICFLLTVPLNRLLEVILFFQFYLSHFILSHLILNFKEYGHNSSASSNHLTRAMR